MVMLNYFYRFKAFPIIIVINQKQYNMYVNNINIVIFKRLFNILLKIRRNYHDKKIRRQNFGSPCRPGRGRSIHRRKGSSHLSDQLICIQGCRICSKHICTDRTWKHLYQTEQSNK